MQGSQEYALVAAVAWLQALLAGQLATVFTIFGVAGLGLAMLHGNASFRQVTRVLLGCFIVFGSATIAGELVALSQPNFAGEIINFPANVASGPNEPVVRHAFVPANATNPFDPYATSPSGNGFGAQP